MIDDLYDFLHARFDEERQAALEALDGAVKGRDELEGPASASKSESGAAILALPPESGVTAVAAKLWAADNCNENERVLRSLAMQYEFHPDYRPEWAL